MSRRAYPTEAFSQTRPAQSAYAPQPAYGAPPQAGQQQQAQPPQQQYQQQQQQAPQQHQPPAAVPMFTPMVPTGAFAPAVPVQQPQQQQQPAPSTAQFAAPTPVAPRIAPQLEAFSSPAPAQAQAAAPQQAPPARAPAPTQPRHEPPPLAGASPAPQQAAYSPSPASMQMAPQQMQPAQPAPVVGKRPVAYSTGGRAAAQYGSQAATGYGSPAGTPSKSVGAVMGAKPAPNPAWDAGNVFCRMTLGAMPKSDSVTDQAGLPFGCVFHPLAKTGGEVPLVNFGNLKIVRCDRCRAYINPYVHFVEGGKRWRCNLCYVLNEGGLPSRDADVWGAVPREYFSLVGQDGRRHDHDQRVELNTSVVEFVASSEFMQRPPQPPVYFFVIDVSYTAIASGMVRAACAAIHKAIEDSLSKNERTRVGFLTVDSAVHYYNLRSSLSTAQMLVVPDVANSFTPLPKDLLVNLAESRHVVDHLLKELLPNVFAKGTDDRSALGPALKGAYDILGNYGGKILVFQSTLPSVGVGKLANRAPPGAVPAEKEKLLLRPGEQFYKNMALECYKKQIGVDMFLFTPKYVDVASLGCLPRYTGGEVNHYLLTQHSPHEANRLQNDIYRVLTRANGFESVLRIRASKGITISSHHGSFFLRGQDLVSLPNTDPDKAYTFRLKIGDSKSFVSPRNLCSDGRNYACVQAGLLYTTTSGERRIRVITKCCPITDQTSELYATADLEASMNLISKLAISKALEEGVAKAQGAIKESCVDTLVKYLRAYPSNTSGQLMLPSTLAKLPLYTLAVCKSALFRSDPTVDSRMADMLRFNTLCTELSTLFCYPNMYNLTAMPDQAGLPGQDGRIVLPPTLELTCEKVDRRGVFLLDNGMYFLLWVGGLVEPQFLQDVFGLQSLAQVDPSNAQLIRRETPTSQRVCNVVDAIRSTRTGYQWLYPMKEKDPIERKFFLHLVHDRFQDNPAFREYAVELQRVATQRKG